MRRLTPAEEIALLYLHERAPYAPGIWVESDVHAVLTVLDELVKKKRAKRADEEDGPIYVLTPRGKWEAEALLAERANA